jgi:hypothetical protein
LYGTYTITLQEFKAVLKASTPADQSKIPKSSANQKFGFKEVRRRKRHSTKETAPTSKKTVPTAASAAVDTPPKEVATRNFYVPLRTSDIDTDSASTTTGRVFSSNLTTPGVSFAAALRGSTQQQQRPQALQVTVASPPVMKKESVPAPGHLQQTGQSVRAAIVNSKPLENMLRVETVVQ